VHLKQWIYELNRLDFEKDPPACENKLILIIDEKVKAGVDPNPKIKIKNIGPHITSFSLSLKTFCLALSFSLNLFSFVPFHHFSFHSLSLHNTKFLLLSSLSTIQVSFIFFFSLFYLFSSFLCYRFYEFLFNFKFFELNFSVVDRT